MLIPKPMIAPRVALETTLLATQDSKVIITKNIAESEEKKATVLNSLSSLIISI